MLKQSNNFKIKVIVPVAHAEDVRNALGKAGAGKFNKYDFCSFMYPVKARSRQLKGEKLGEGEIGNIEETDEMCIECVCNKDILEEVIFELKKTHPHKEPTIDILSRFEINDM